MIDRIGRCRSANEDMDECVMRTVEDDGMKSVIVADRNTVPGRQMSKNWTAVFLVVAAIRHAPDSRLCRRAVFSKAVLFALLIDSL